MIKNIWSVIRVVLMFILTVYWSYLAVSKPWPNGLFAAAWCFFLVDGTIEEIKSRRKPTNL